MRTVTTALSVLGASGCWYFVVAYWWTTRGDWAHNPAGRHVMQFTANLGLLLSLAVAARIWPDYPGRQTITLIVFAALVAQIYWRIVLLHRAQHEPSGRR